MREKIVKKIKLQKTQQGNPPSGPAPPAQMNTNESNSPDKTHKNFVLKLNHNRRFTNSLVNQQQTHSQKQHPSSEYQDKKAMSIFAQKAMKGADPLLSYDHD
jgi:hypothetical protein